MEEKLTNAIAANLNVTPQQAEILLKTRKPDVDVVFRPSDSIFFFNY